MAKSADLGRYDLSGIRHAVSAGEPLNPEVIRVFEDAFGLHDPRRLRPDREHAPRRQLRRAWRSDRARWGSPLPGHEIAVIGEAGEELPAGEEGDIALRGRPPTLFAGYWEAPDETAAAVSAATGTSPATGRLRDEDGYFWFAGRADDVILSAAYRIGPFEVESALLEHAAVAESAVVGKPDADRGQIVKAFVVLRPGHEASDVLARGAPGPRQARNRSVQVPARDRVRPASCRRPEAARSAASSCASSRSDARRRRSLSWPFPPLVASATTACAATCSCCNDQMAALRDELLAQGMVCGDEGGLGITLSKLESPANQFVPPIEIEEALEPPRPSRWRSRTRALWRDFLVFLEGAAQHGGLRVKP